MVDDIKLGAEGNISTFKCIINKTIWEYCCKSNESVEPRSTKIDRRWICQKDKWNSDKKESFGIRSGNLHFQKKLIQCFYKTHNYSINNN